MRDFSKVSPAVWESERFGQLPDSDAKLAYLYLLSCRHANSIGCFRLPPAYAAADLKWTEAAFLAALDSLKENGLAEYDNETREVLIPRWFRHNPPTNSKHYLGARRIVGNVSSERFRAIAEQTLEEAWKKRQADTSPIPPSAPGQSTPAVSNELLERLGRRGA